MRCKDIQRLITAMSEDDPTDGSAEAVKRHVEACPECARFSEGLGRLRVGLQDGPRPLIPRDLDARTKEKCLSVLRSSGTIGAETNDGPRPAPLPKPVWAALFAITALTLALMIPLIKNFKPDEPVTLQTAVMLALMIQNAVMLLFTPLLMKKYRPGFSGSQVD